MKWNTLLFSFGLAILSIFFFFNKSKKIISGEYALQIAKQAFSKDGIVEGSWIQMTPEKMVKNNHVLLVYKGGITRKNEQETERIEFCIDSQSGTIVEASQLS